MGGKRKLTLEQCKEIRKELLEGANSYLLGREYKVSEPTIKKANLEAMALEIDMTWDDMVLWQKNYFAYDKDTGQPILFSDSKEKVMLSMNDLVVGLGIVKSNISRIINKLGIVAHKKRGKKQQWEYYFDTKQIAKILKYREGLSHGLTLTEFGYEIKEES